MRGEMQATIGFLESLANRLDGWAQQSRDYGWSTHQVKANEDAANQCRRVAANLRLALADEEKLR